MIYLYENTSVCVKYAPNIENLQPAYPELTYTLKWQTEYSQFSSALSSAVLISLEITSTAIHFVIQFPIKLSWHKLMLHLELDLSIQMPFKIHVKCKHEPALFLLKLKMCFQLAQKHFTVERCKTCEGHVPHAPDWVVRANWSKLVILFNLFIQQNTRYHSEWEWHY